MNHRDRFNNLFDGKPVDRVPFADVMGKCNFKSCLDRWKAEGLDGGAAPDDIVKLIGFDYSRGWYIPVHSYVFPLFEIKKLDDERRINHWGSTEICPDNPDLMPITVVGPVSDRNSWESFKERFIYSPDRLVNSIEAECKQALDSGLPIYAGDLPIGFFGALRELFGSEEVLYIFYDDPKLVHDILGTLTDLWIKIYSDFSERVSLDYFFVWEDMCFKNGPLISPAVFEEFLLPCYQRFTSALKAASCKHFFVDSDGDERPLIPLWQRGGIDIFFPFEVQCGVDVCDVRKEFPDIGIIGGLDKNALKYDKSAMDKELLKVPPMIENGRYIPCLDHGVTNEVPWSNYLYFYDRLRELVYKYQPQR